MKQVLLPLMLLFCGTSIFGQINEPSKNIARIGINGGFFGSGDIYMPAPYLEYTRILRPWVALTPRLMWAHLSKQSESGFKINTSFDASISLSFTPFPNRLRQLKLHVGGLYHKLEKSSGYLPYPEIDPYYVQNFQYYRDSGFGLIGSLSYNFIDKEKIESGLRMDMLTTFYDQSLNSESIQFGIFLGVRF